MSLLNALNLPETDKNVIVVLSGGLDSSSMAIVLVEHYGADRVTAISFDYGQKQKLELTKAAELSKVLGINHRVLDLSILGEIARPFSANIAGSSISMPTITEVLGEPQPVTYVPNRNMIMYSIVAAAAEVADADHIFCGLQVHDAYGYWDTTQEWVDSMNQVLSQNRKHPITISAPFATMSKLDEIQLIRELGMTRLFAHTLTCYDPDESGRSCGVCPSCAERIAAFGKAGIVDPIPYAIDLDWASIINQLKV
jgi:7-cyano-7-deazaguanine synthase